MKFFRHLAAVVLAVAVIVGLGMLWAHACGGGTGSGSALRRVPSREALLRLEQVKAGVIRVHSGNGFHLVDTGDLIRTCVIEAVLAAVVITVSAAQRRHHRGHRTAAVRATSNRLARCGLIGSDLGAYRPTLVPCVVLPGHTVIPGRSVRLCLTVIQEPARGGSPIRAATLRN